MPELPEVETVVRTLIPRLRGRTFATLRHLRPDMLRPANTDFASLLPGRRVERITRRGKRILIHLDSGDTLAIHLGMTGQLTVEPSTVPIKPHTHLILELADTNAHSIEPSIATLRFRDPRRFGSLTWISADSASDDTLGPEPLSLRSQQLARLLSHTRRAIKTALLDQSLLAGLGNIYADEALFHAQIHPTTPANRLTLQQVQRLNRAIKLILRRAIRHRGSSLRDYIDVNGSSGRYQNLHAVYARTGQPCRRCGSTIVRIVLGGRSTHFCSNCQKARPRRKDRARSG